MTRCESYIAQVYELSFLRLKSDYICKLGCEREK